MSRNSRPKAKVNRRKGETGDQCRRRNREAHIGEWIKEKIASGKWIAEEEFRCTRGRSGRKVTATPKTTRIKSRRSSNHSKSKTTKRPASVHAKTKKVSSATNLKKTGVVLATEAGLSAGLEVLGEVLEKGAGVDVKKTAKKAAVTGFESAARTGATRLVEKPLESLAMKTLGKSVANAGARTATNVGVRHAAKAAFRGNVVSQIAVFVVEQGINTGKLAMGSIDGSEYGRRTAENAGSSAGGLGGTVAGAAIGTAICPGIGTAIGGIMGGICGSLGGSFGVQCFTR